MKLLALPFAVSLTLVTKPTLLIPEVSISGFRHHMYVVTQGAVELMWASP